MKLKFSNLISVNRIEQYEQYEQYELVNREKHSRIFIRLKLLI
mgnify:CR=1 FL=1